MSNESLRYGQRGVSASKEDVHYAIKNIDQGLYPKAFAKIYPDYLGGDSAFVNLMSSDGSGTKSVLAYLYWKETGDVSVWKGISQDALVMNMDDLLCVGASKHFLYSSVINRNKRLIPRQVLSALIEGTQECIDIVAKYGVDIHLMGGETADLGDIVRTTTVDGSMTCRMPKKDLIIASNIKQGNVIVGLSSAGQATYETAYNSGIGSNGLTSARHDVLSDYFLSSYPETVDSSTPKEVVYIGSKKLTDIIPESTLNVGKLLLSPTRTYAPVLKDILASFRSEIDALIHCTGGGQTKVLHFLNDGLSVIKDNFMHTPPVFNLIQSESGTDWKEMYKVFNMGHRLEIYTNESAAQDMIDIAGQYNIEAQVIGRVEKSGRKEVVIDSFYGTFNYN